MVVDSSRHPTYFAGMQVKYKYQFVKYVLIFVIFQYCDKRYCEECDYIFCEYPNLKKHMTDNHAQSAADNWVTCLPFP